jgi:hypothetical protein
MFNRVARSIFYRWFLAAIATLSFTLIGTHNLNAETRSKSVSFDASVPAKMWYGIALPNLLANVRLNINGTSSNKITIYLFTRFEDESHLPADDDALLTIASVDTYDFEFEIPADGDYVLVMDNRNGDVQVEYKFAATVYIDVP